MTVKVGAFDPDAWAGLVLADRPGRGFAVRWAIERDGERADGPDLLNLVHDVGPHDPDGRYALISFDTSLPFGKGNDTPIVAKGYRTAGLILEWSRTDDGAVMRATVEFAGVLELRGYFPWDWHGSWKAEADRLVATTGDGEVACLVQCDRHGTPAQHDHEAALRFDVSPGDVIVLSAAAVPAAPPAVASAASPAVPPAVASAASPAPPTPDLLTAASLSYSTSRVVTEGAWRGLSDSIANNLHWMVCLQPETGRCYTPAGRRWIFPTPTGGREHWTVFCWDAFLTALELGLESETLARETLEAVLDTQFENGCIPNWRGRYWGTRDRSQPPIGSFCVLKHFARFGDHDLLARAFPILERWAAWWTADVRGRPRRDGNDNGLCEWGSDDDLVGESPAVWEKGASGTKRAMWESGQDDLPNWDAAGWDPSAGTMMLDAVDLNSYRVLDHECLGIIALELGLGDRGAWHTQRAQAIRDAMNATLWDEQTGAYRDRHWDGPFSPRLAAANFLPLLAGVPTPERAHRMLSILNDPAQFWGDYVIPTIGRGDPAFADQQYWRGTIWPPTNYLIYQGLRRYRFDAVAAELAQKSVTLFLGTWHEHRLCRENYDARTGEGGGHRYQSWGPLFALMGVEEFLDVTPWDGLRFGSAAVAAQTVLRRVPAAGHRWDVTLSPAGLLVGMDGDMLLASDRPVVLRNTRVGADTVSAEVTAHQAAMIHTSTDSAAVSPGVSRLTLRRI